MTGRLPFAPVLLGRRIEDDAPVRLSADELVRHLAVFGTTGSGKTSTLLALVCQLMDRGRGFLFCTSKHDPLVPRALAWAAFKRHQLWRLRIVDPMHPVHSYNPIATRNPLLLAKLYQSQLPPIEPGSEAQHYHDIAFEFLAVACRALVATQLAHTPEDLYHIAANWDTVRPLLERRLRAVGRADALVDLDGFFRRFYRGSQFQVDLARSELSGLTATLNALQMTRFGEVVAQARSDVNLLEDCRRARWIYMGLPRASDADAGRFGRMFLTDLIAVIDEIQSSEGTLAHAPFTIILDEFPSYAVQEFAVVFEQARSAGIALIMGAQAVSGLSDRSSGLSEQFRDRVLGNCAHIISFRIGPGEGARYLAEYVGQADRRFEQVSETTSAGRSWSPLSPWAWLGLSNESRQRAAFHGWRVQKDRLLESRALTHELAQRGEAYWLSAKDGAAPFRFRAVWSDTADAPQQWPYWERCARWSPHPPRLLNLGVEVRARQLRQSAPGTPAETGAAQGRPSEPAPAPAAALAGSASRPPQPGAEGRPGAPRRRPRRGPPPGLAFTPPGT